MKIDLIIFGLIILADSFGIINQSESIASDYVSAKQLSSEVNTEFTMPAKIPIEELIGKKYGMLTIIGEAEPHKQSNGLSIRIMECLCDCGNKCQIYLKHLRSEATASCGCYQIMRVRETKVIHGQKGKNGRSQIYVIWVNMKQRCINSKSSHYKRYGGRGIKVCSEWANDFINFYNWAIASGYKKGLSIDRINNNRNYEPSNCQWLTVKENSIKGNR